jgi:hypothetical protein
MYVEVFPPRRRQHFTTMQNKWSNNSVNVLIFNVFESSWNELSIINKQHFMNMEFLLVHPELSVVFGILHGYICFEKSHDFFFTVVVTLLLILDLLHAQIFGFTWSSYFAS